MQARVMGEDHEGGPPRQSKEVTTVLGQLTESDCTSTAVFSYLKQTGVHFQMPVR